MESCASHAIAAAGSVDELRMSCERGSGFRSDVFIAVFLFGLYRKYREFLPFGSPAELMGPSVAATGGVSHSNNSFRLAWPKRANLSTCYSSQSVFAATLLYYAESSKGIAFISFTS